MADQAPYGTWRSSLTVGDIAWITHALEAELSFYSQVLGFHPQHTPHLRMHGLSDEEHPASSDTSSRPEEVSTRG
ncbi:hypothetical protein [Streptomyces sp. NPDC050121]|uniref:hypothetical protein n=1 Tax=Streptomyces sp. NPDC050121 TaxID=3365601 RepID=UPI0037B034DA